MKIESLSIGQIVYEVGRSKMGNTTVSTVGIWHIQIYEVDLQTRTVKASWNSNPVREFRERSWKKWRTKKPALIKSGFGYRLATREELKALKARAPQ